MSNKVLITASTFQHLSHFHQPYIRAFHEMGWEVHIGGADDSAGLDCADEIISLPFKKSFFSASNFKAARQLRVYIRRSGYDLIICHTSLAAFFTRLAAVGIKRQTKIINVVHGYLFDDDTPVLKSMVLKLAELVMAKQTDLVITMNEWDYQWAGTHRAAKALSFVQGIGYDADRCKNCPEEYDFGTSKGDYVLIYPAEFSKRKNQAMLIRAMRLLPDRVKLLLPGSGALLRECRALAKSLGLEKRVIFPGYIQNVPAALRQADAAVTSSRSEGLPFNVLEAMNCALPVVASDVKGNRDLVRDGVNGFLFPSDDEAAFAAAVEKLMNDRASGTRMGKTGQALAEKYSIEKVLPKLMTEYMSVTAEPANK